MTNFLNTLSIENFKSIKNMAFDCKRINVFIGEPNVGKSNILEAISLLNSNYYRTNPLELLRKLIRHEELSNLFYDDDLANKIVIGSDRVTTLMEFNKSSQNSYQLVVAKTGDINNILLERLKGLLGPFGFQASFSSSGSGYGENPEFEYLDLIKTYKFKEQLFLKNDFFTSLLQPYGENLFFVIDQNKELRKEISQIFDKYGLEFVADKKEGKFFLQKKEDGYINTYPYSLMADTFQRLFFYYAAIDSNKDSVLILEEPEVHSFPQYTLELANRIVNSESNQFFIATHSPYLLQNLISDVDFKDLNVFITYYENYETKVKALSQEQLRDVSDSSMDIFFNLKNFI
jgi:AAA15 family ATPase/GTPase